MSWYNSDLSNPLGNLVNRTVSMVNKYFDGVIQSGDVHGDFDDDLKAVASCALEKVENKMETLHVADSLDEIWRIVNRANKYIDETTPWILAKNESDLPRLGTVLYNLIEAIRIIASLLTPFMPETAEKIKAQINASDLSSESAKTFGVTAAGTKVGAPEPLFSRIDTEKKLAELAEEFSAASEAEPAVEIEPFKPSVTFDDFEKLDVRVGKVKVCEKVPKSSKLLRFEIECGGETRQILSGIAKFYKPEDLVGKNVLFIANFPPRKMMGLESNGMILSAEYKDSLTLLTTADDIQSGAVMV